MEGRQILDFTLIADKVLDSRVCNKIPRVIWKLDIENAYEHLYWDSLLFMLARYGFGKKCRRWINISHTFISSTSCFSQIPGD